MSVCGALGATDEGPFVAAKWSTNYATFIAAI
jgi:hypothetical protein